MKNLFETGVKTFDENAGELRCGVYTFMGISELHNIMLNFTNSIQKTYRYDKEKRAEAILYITHELTLNEMDDKLNMITYNHDIRHSKIDGERLVKYVSHNELTDKTFNPELILQYYVDKRDLKNCIIDNINFSKFDIRYIFVDNVRDIETIEWLHDLAIKHNIIIFNGVKLKRHIIDANNMYNLFEYSRYNIDLDPHMISIPNGIYIMNIEDELKKENEIIPETNLVFKTLKTRNENASIYFKCKWDKEGHRFINE